MPSKGIKCFTYIAAPDIEIKFSVPKHSITKHQQQTFTVSHLEVESSNLSTFQFTGQFKFTVQKKDGGHEIASQWLNINSLTGSLEDGTMKDMDQTPSIFTKDGLIIAYGFYDAGPGVAGLPKQHQCYVTVTKNYANWMRDVIPPGSAKSQRKFSKVVLPSAHDVGMNSMQTSLALLQSCRSASGVVKEVLGRSLPSAFEVLNKVSDTAVMHIAPDIIRALAVTQKDSVQAVLKIGARYFEFRPAKCHRKLMMNAAASGQGQEGVEDTWYFQHGAIPGMSYKQFVHDVVEFLLAHEGEIVVVHNRWDGVPDECPRPSNEELKRVLDDVLKKHNNRKSKDKQHLRAGNKEDMAHKTIAELRSSNTRLIVLHSIPQFSNYDDDANATLTGESMVRKLHDLSTKPSHNHPITLLQCQATATNIRDVIVASVLDSDVSTSPILATKPVCDEKLLPLLRGEVGKKFGRGDGLMVVLNDFFCGATADVAVEMCKERLG